MNRIVVAAFIAGLISSCKLPGQGDEIATPPLPDPHPGSVAEPIEVKPEQVEKFVLDSWLDTQNKGDAEGYVRLLASEFSGTTLDAGGQPTTFEHDEWVERRSKALRRKPVITLEEIVVVGEPTASETEVTFTQTWETDTYCDTGTKRLAVRFDGKEFSVISEVMESVGECDWVSEATLLTFLDAYRKALKKEDLDYLTDHTCIPFDDEVYDYKAETEDIRQIRELGRVPTDVLVKMKVAIKPRTQTLGGQQWESILQMKNDDAAVMFGDVDDLDNHTFSFLFEEGVWKYCKHVQELTKPTG